MSGLEKILGVISSEADAEAAEKIDAAKAAAEEAKKAASQRAEAESGRILAAANAEAQNILDRAKSAAALSERQALLNAKQSLISSVTEEALRQMKSLPDQEYFDVVLRLAGIHGENLPGMIRFSAADLKRLPQDFAGRLDAVLKAAGKTEASLKISDAAADIDGGFILIYGDIEENCTFEALFAEQADDLLDVANKALFG